MKFKTQAVYAVLTAILAGVVTLVTQAMGGWPNPTCMANGNALTFISFATWACYFLAGCTVKGALNWIWSMFGGAIAAMFMFILTFKFMGGMGYLAGVSVAVIIVVWFMMFPEKLKMNAAAVFIGTAMFFALHAAGAGIDGSAGVYVNVIISEMIYTAIGLAAGWLTIFFNVWCTKHIGAKDEDARAE